MSKRTWTCPKCGRENDRRLYCCLGVRCEYERKIEPAHPETAESVIILDLVSSIGDFLVDFVATGERTAGIERRAYAAVNKANTFLRRTT